MKVLITPQYGKGCPNLSASLTKSDQLPSSLDANIGDLIQYAVLESIITNEFSQEPLYLDIKGANQIFDSRFNDLTEQYQHEDLVVPVCGYRGLYCNLFSPLILEDDVIPGAHLVYIGISISDFGWGGVLSNKIGFSLASKLGVAQQLKPFQPIGCRDRATMRFLKEQGVAAYYSGCVTMGMYQRTAEQSSAADKIFIVDLQPQFWMHIPEEVKAQAERSISHLYQYKTKMPALSKYMREYKAAKNILKIYAERAALLISSRVHAVLPCLAMNIPLIFMSDCTDQRMDMFSLILKQVRSTDSFDFKQINTDHSYFCEVSSAVRENIVSRLAGREDGSIGRLTKILEHKFI